MHCCLGGRKEAGQGLPSNSSTPSVNPNQNQEDPETFFFKKNIDALSFFFLFSTTGTTFEFEYAAETTVCNSK